MKSSAETRGLPFIRTYSLDEIGNVPRNLRLGFDAFGRVAVMYDGIYDVLNDTVWVDQIDPNPADNIRMTKIESFNGSYYYGGRGSWGTVGIAADGHFHAQPLVPRNAPVWTSVTAFNQMLPTTAGVYFYDLNGVAYWDFARRTNYFFELPRLSQLFRLGDRVFVSCQDRIIREILRDSGTVRTVTVEGITGSVVEAAAPLDPGHTLLALQDGRLGVFDGHTLTPWAGAALPVLSGKISLIKPLVEGGVAIAISGKGIFLVSAQGVVQWSLTTPEFYRVGDMAAGEPGVLWVAGENAVRRVFYHSPLTSFGQQLGLNAIWPKIASCNSRIFVCSNHNLYELKTSTAGSSAQFYPVAGTPEEGTDCMATSGNLLLTGNSSGVFFESHEGKLTQAISLENVAGLEFIDPTTCLAIGSKEIAALTFRDGKWIESAPRIAGIGESPIRTTRNRAIWIEMGADRVARLTYEKGNIKLERLVLPWLENQWTNVGVVGDIIVLSGSLGQRAFYDDALDRFCAAPELSELLNRAPYWITRVTTDASGTLWATHAQGVITLTPDGNGYVMDATTFELRNDSYPEIHLLPGNSIWIAAGRSLYHVEPKEVNAFKPPHVILVSLMAEEANREMLPQTAPTKLPARLAFDNNSLSFRFFSGTYAWRTPPVYEYRLVPSDPWSKVDPSLLLHFPKLREGAYQLEVRSAAHTEGQTPIFTFGFSINPPWYRTIRAYAAFGALVLILIAGLVRWTNHHSLRRNAELQHLVDDRTGQLKDAMEKLGEETKNAAILAERSRLAGELHDSIQQGLSGSILQLDTTLDNSAIQTEVRSQLSIVRQMLSYTREEVQQAVWNLESPLLQASDLGMAIRNLAGLLNSGSITMNVTVPDQPISLEPTIQHNLLRIAQEAIGNAVKHAGANRIDVDLSVEEGAIDLSIADDGVGFDCETRPKGKGHFGLRGMRTRAKSLKSALVVKSSPGQGTLVQIKVSLNKPLFNDHDQKIQPT